MSNFYINNEFITLIALLKVTGLASSGGEAQMLVEEGLVTVNDNPETRKRAKLRHGDKISCNGVNITVQQKEAQG